MKFRDYPDIEFERIQVVDDVRNQAIELWKADDLWMITIDRKPFLGRRSAVECRNELAYAKLRWRTV